MNSRFLDLTLGDPFRNMALEEALFRVAKVPVVRVWDNQRSVILGRAQLAEAETDLDYCRREGIPVVRRFTAGGTVYNGPGNTNWTFIAPRDFGVSRFAYSDDAKKIFSMSAGLVVEALAACSVKARFEPPNRIVDAGGVKVSGMAAYVSNRVSICHGTLLIGADLEELERLTTPAPSDRPRRYPRSLHARTSNCGVERSEFVRHLARAAEVPLEPGNLSKEEEVMTSRFFEERYGRREWNLGDPFSIDYLQSMIGHD